MKEKRKVPSDFTTHEQMFFDRLAATICSKNQVWFENRAFLHEGSMYHTGGTDGIYICIAKDGCSNAGNYSEALQGINSAILKPIIKVEFSNFSEALDYWLNLAGTRFYIDYMNESKRRTQEFIEETQSTLSDNDLYNDNDEDEDEYER